MKARYRVAWIGQDEQDASKAVVMLEREDAPAHPADFATGLRSEAVFGSGRPNGSLLLRVERKSDTPQFTFGRIFTLELVPE